MKISQTLGSLRGRNFLWQVTFQLGVYSKTFIANIYKNHFILRPTLEMYSTTFLLMLEKFES